MKPLTRFAFTVGRIPVPAADGGWVLAESAAARFADLEKQLAEKQHTVTRLAASGNCEFHNYQDKASRTVDLTKALPTRRLNFALGLAGETGEVIELIKKESFHGKPMDRDALCNELGDVLWYLTGLAEAYGLTLRQVAERNIQKLEERYPNGFRSHGEAA